MLLIQKGSSMVTKQVNFAPRINKSRETDCINITAPNLRAKYIYRTLKHENKSEFCSHTVFVRLL